MRLHLAFRAALGVMAFPCALIVQAKEISLKYAGPPTKAAFLDEPCDTAMNALRHTGNFLIHRWGYTPEHRFALAVRNIDAIQSQDMEMRAIPGTMLFGIHA